MKPKLVEKEKKQRRIKTKPSVSKNLKKHTLNYSCINVGRFLIYNQVTLRY